MSTKLSSSILNRANGFQRPFFTHAKESAAHFRLSLHFVLFFTFVFFSREKRDPSQLIKVLREPKMLQQLHLCNLTRSKNGGSCWPTHAHATCSLPAFENDFPDQKTFARPRLAHSRKSLLSSYIYTRRTFFISCPSPRPFVTLFFGGI